MLIEFLILIAICAVCFYRWAVKNNNYFKERNIPHDKPFFLLGSGKDILLRRKTIIQAMCDVYNQHDGIIYGVFDNRKPVLLIRDPDLIKCITIKDFDHFVNRNNFLSESSDNLFSNSLVLMKNEKWRDMRSTLSPAFTGSKMRKMFTLILQTVNEAMKYLGEQQSKHLTEVNVQEEEFELDVKDFTTRLTNDIIASTAFGLNINSYRDKENEFYMRAIKAMKFSFWQIIKMLFMLSFPDLAQKLKLDIFDRDFSNYFMSLVLDTIKYRTENNIHRPDMINLLMEARGMIPSDTKKSHYREWSDLDVVSQCFVFFIAGFEPSSGLMTFAAHEIMENPIVQEKLYEEIKDVHQQLQGEEITFEILQKMTYMDMVVSEVLRKWPIALQLERSCNQDFVYESPEGERVEIKSGELVRIAMVGIQRDPKYFENPEVLDPERFSEENKTKIIPGTYLPFGLGPRNCIGNRFALLEAKAFLYYLVRDYQLNTSPKTPVPLELDKKSIQLKPKNGFWLKLKPRQKLL